MREHDDDLEVGEVGARDDATRIAPALASGLERIAQALERGLHDLASAISSAGSATRREPGRKVRTAPAPSHRR